MKIVINKTSHGIYAAGHLLVPGTNCLEKFDETKYDVKKLAGLGQIVVKDPEKMSEAEQVEAVEKTNLQSTLETLGKTFKNVDTSKRKKKLDDYDKAVKDAENK